MGFGRFGEFFWGFSQQGVVPDIVTVGVRRKRRGRKGSRDRRGRRSRRGGMGRRDSMDIRGIRPLLASHTTRIHPHNNTHTCTHVHPALLSLHPNCAYYLAETLRQRYATRLCRNDKGSKDGRG